MMDSRIEAEYRKRYDRTEDYLRFLERARQITESIRQLENKIAREKEECLNKVTIHRGQIGYFRQSCPHDVVIAGRCLICGEAR